MERIVWIRYPVSFVRYFLEYQLQYPNSQGIFSMISWIYLLCRAAIPVVRLLLIYDVSSLSYVCIARIIIIALVRRLNQLFAWTSDGIIYDLCAAAAVSTVTWLSAWHNTTHWLEAVRYPLPKDSVIREIERSSVVCVSGSLMINYLLPLSDKFLLLCVVFVNISIMVFVTCLLNHLKVVDVTKSSCLF